MAQCQSCAGRGQVKCPDCDGTGKASCFTCAGTGTNLQGKPCGICGGKKKIPCVKTVTCMACQGKGQV
jgi:hypothetical protein